MVTPPRPPGRGGVVASESERDGAVILP